MSIRRIKLQTLLAEGIRRGLDYAESLSRAGVQASNPPYPLAEADSLYNQLRSGNPVLLWSFTDGWETYYSVVWSEKYKRFFNLGYLPEQ
jgi:hypothetical protein